MSALTRSLSENRRTLALAAPIVAGFLGQMLMGWADTIMVGRIGVLPLAACAFANTILAVPMVFGFGLLSGISVRASHAFGAGDNERCGESLRSGLWLSLGAGLLIAAALQASASFLGIYGQPGEVTEASRTFLILCGWSMVPVLVTTAAKNFCEALGRPWVPFWLVIGGVLLNIFLNWVFIYGNLGAPALGLEGAGLATLIARLAIMTALLAYVFRSPFIHRYLTAGWWSVRTGPECRRLLLIGLPSGLMHFAEVSGFAACSLMMGWLSINALAAHQIALTCAATTFMIPLGIAQAVSVRIGQARGTGQIERCAPILGGATGFVITAMTLCMACFVFAGTLIAGWFVDDRAVRLLAADLLLMAGFFQIFDGVQVVCTGALRGFEDTRVPMLIGIFSYWLVVLPVSYGLAFHAGLGPRGVWLGLVAGLGVAAVALASRVVHRLRKSVATR